MSKERRVSILESRFVGGFKDLKQLSKINFPEIAFMGRSNSGKSTFINRLLKRKNLARTSSKPGMTRSINYYEIKVEIDGEKKNFNLVDFPGFGYARFSKKEREYFARLIVDFINTRDQLAALFLLLDIKREPKEDELAIANLCASRGVVFIPVATKCDKIKKRQVEEQKKRIATAYGVAKDQLIIAGEGIGTDLAVNKIAEVIVK